MQLIPSRVIIWTTPYKQLYKDPALVVSFGEKVCRIDELEYLQGEIPAGYKSALNLVQSSIGDADNKYAALWKLYVFISDGLFYTGMLSKFSTQPSESKNHQKEIEEHRIRLKKSQAIFIAAFDVVCHNWSELERFENRQKQLESKMDKDRFKTLINRWIAARF